MRPSLYPVEGRGNRNPKPAFPFNDIVNLMPARLAFRPRSLKYSSRASGRNRTGIDLALQYRLDLTSSVK